LSRFLDDLFSLEGQKAVVIGGTGTLCGRMCHALALAGAVVVVAGRSEARGTQRVQKILEAGGKAMYLPVEVSSRESIEALLDASLRRVGTIDILINGAGINSAVAYHDIADEEWDRILAANVRGVHVACQIFSSRMIEQKRGSIINVASVSAVVPLSRVFAYSASKAAVVNYSQNLARELAPSGVRVNCLSPGFFPAEQNRKILDAERTGKVLAKTPMRRFGEPHELDGAVLLLASNAAGGFITGANILVDGGFTAMSI
jgi:NAD(P)-dependent dehydrogenase (short-subunit alcohol dehydrogenase family)